MSIQVQQLLNLIFLVVISYSLELQHNQIGLLVFYVLVAISIEHTLIYIKHKKIDFFSFSSVTTVLGITLMMFSDDWWIYILVILLALLQKHFLTLHRRHLFNPSNFALIMAMFLFYTDAHIVLGQLGDDVWLRTIVILLGTVVLVRAKRILITFLFISFYLILQYQLVVSYDMTMVLEDIYLRFYSVSFLVFIFFMLTDPRTTPNTYRLQAIFIFILVLISTLLDRYYGFRVQHLFMALFVLTPLVVLYESYSASSLKIYDIGKVGAVALVSLLALTYIQSQPPYYFAMDY